MSESDKNNLQEECAYFESFVQEGLAHKSQETPAHIISRIAAARNQALNDAEKEQHRSIWKPALVLGALVLTTAVVMIKLQPGSELIQAEAVEDVDILLVQQEENFQDELELYENLEFYTWLENNDEMG